MKKGFSLIELSVVIVIIGLLVGVLVAAQSIRNTAQVQAVITDFGKYKQAAVQYKEKYYYWPGDDPGAGSVWHEITSAGDGNGQIGYTSLGNGSNVGDLSDPENTMAFKELSLAGFITGDYINGDPSTILTPVGYFPKAPISIVSGAYLPAPMYYFIYQTLGVPNPVGKNAINISDILVGGVANDHGGGNGIAPSGAIKPSDALAIDIKIDDGAPNTGYVRGLDNPVGVTLCAPNGNNYDVADDSNGGSCISSFSME